MSRLERRQRFPSRHYAKVLICRFPNRFPSAQAMGMTVEMLPAKGPHFPEPLQTPKDIEKLPVWMPPTSVLSAFALLLSKPANWRRNDTKIARLTAVNLVGMQTEVDVEKELGYVYEAIKETVKRLDGRVPLIGFCGGPVCRRGTTARPNDRVDHMFAHDPQRRFAVQEPHLCVLPCVPHSGHCSRT
jgi:hypothetical protein